MTRGVGDDGYTKAHRRVAGVDGRRARAWKGKGETWYRKGKLMEGDTDGTGDWGGTQESGDGYDANAWPESFPEVGGSYRRTLPLELPRTTDPRGQRKSCSERSLERGAGLRETLNVKAAYMSHPEPRRAVRCVEFLQAGRRMQNNQRMTEARRSGRRTNTRILTMFP